MMRQIVTSYKNPDLDGVASSIALSVYLRKVKGLSVEPIVFGNLDSETRFILDTLKIPYPRTIPKFSPEDIVYLVDTHHIKQINSNVIPECVVQIYDHHPVGTPEAFPNARIVNEKVGAVATILVERFIDGNIPLDPLLAILLYAAIISNTLNFSAPTTTERDRKAAEWLSKQATIPVDLPERMFEVRSNFDALTTEELLSGGYKEFDFAGIKIGISQIEGAGVAKLLSRSDIETVIAKIRSRKEVDHMFLSAVDIYEQKTYLVTDRKETQAMLSEIIGAEFSVRVAVFNRILLRKSDLIPPLKSYYSRPSHLEV